MTDTNKNIIVRQAQSSDFEQVARLEKQVFDLHADHRPDLFRPGADGTLNRKRFDELMSGDKDAIFVADEGGTVLGFVQVSIQDLSDRTWTPIRTKVDIDAIGVDESRRGEGIGTLLLSAAERWAKEHGATFITMSVHDFNSKARHAYESAGYRSQRTLLDKRLEP